jgi:hypothetical protein
MRKILLPFRPVSVSLLFCFRDLAIFVLTVHCISRKGGSFAPIDQLGNDIDIGFPCLISGWRPLLPFAVFLAESLAHPSPADFAMKCSGED